MLKSILISFCFIFMLSANSKILTDEHEVHKSEFCSTKLINLYANKNDSHSDTRTSFVPSELLKNSCTDFQDSCCLDEEFETMTNIAQKSLQHLYNGVVESQIAFKMLDQLKEKKIKEIIAEVGAEKIEEYDLTEEEIIEDLKYLREEWNDISLDLTNTYKMVEEYGGGLNCTLCEARNHSNFTNIDKINDVKLIFDFSYCYQLFNSEYLLSTLDFVRHLKPMTTLSKLLSGFYEVRVGDHFRDSIEKVDQIDGLRKSCLASVDDFSDDEQCAEMCIELGKPNQFFFKDIINPLTTFVVIVTDYFGTRELLIANSKESTELGNEESVVTPQETIDAFIDHWDVNYILPPADEYSPINLNRMKVELGYDKGWNFHTIRFKKWGIARETASILKAIGVLLLSVSLLF